MKYNKNYFNLQTTKQAKLYKKYIDFIERGDIKLNNLFICDIGCATGEFIKSIYTNNSCYGVDISSYAIKSCQKKFPQIKNNFWCLDLNKQAINKKVIFDIITLFDVIEHLDSFIYFEKIINMNLARGGYVVITTPNANSFIRPIRKKLFTGEIDVTHKMLFTPYTLDFFLRKKGLKKVKLFTPYSFFFKDNFLTQNFLFGGQIFAVYEKI